jgi:hypothetical protein
MPALWQRIIASKLTLLFSGLAAGAVTAPLLGRAARPVVRGLIRAGLVAQRELLEIAAKLREEVEDIAAETKHELGERTVPVEHEHERGHREERAEA